VANDLLVYNSRRLVLVRFLRAATGAPKADAPDIDDRGYADPTRGAIVGMTKGRTIKVKLTRVRIAEAASLFVESSDKGVVKVTDPADGKVPSAKTATIVLEGVKGGEPAKAKIQVRYGTDASGPLIHELTVYVFTPIKVPVTPHVATIAQAGSQSVTPVRSNADVEAMFKIVKAAWLPCGIEFEVGKVVEPKAPFQFRQAGVVWMDAEKGKESTDKYPHAEFKTVIQTDHVAGTLNAWFIPRFGSASASFGAGGIGMSRLKKDEYKLPATGVFSADMDPTGTTLDADARAHILAHEIGHCLTLWHTGKAEQSADKKENLWAHRSLMFNSIFKPGNDVGYGKSGTATRAGQLIAMKDLWKDLANEVTAECSKARKEASEGGYG